MFDSSRNEVVISVPVELVKASLAIIADYFYTTHCMTITQQQAVHTALYHFACALPRIKVKDIINTLPYNISSVGGMSEAKHQFKVPTAIHMVYVEYARMCKVETNNLAAIAIIYAAESFADCTDKISSINKLIKESKPRKKK